MLNGKQVKNKLPWFFWFKVDQKYCYNRSHISLLRILRELIQEKGNRVQ